MDSIYPVGKLLQYFCGDFGFMRTTMCILGIADLKKHFIELLLLLAMVDMFIVVFNAAVFSLLFCVVFIECLIKQFVINLLNIFTNKSFIFMCATLIDIRDDELSIVLTDVAFAAAFLCTPFGLPCGIWHWHGINNDEFAVMLERHGIG